MTLYDLIDLGQHLRIALKVAGWLLVALVAYVAIVVAGALSPVIANVLRGAVGFDWDFWNRRWVWRPWRGHSR